MQSTHDRDKYVNVLWENIEPDSFPQFSKYTSKVVTNFGQQYDYDSIMHYHVFAFTKNGQPTILAKVSGKLFTIKSFNLRIVITFFPFQDKAHKFTVGQRIKLSELDIVKLNRMYKCTE